MMQGHFSLSLLFRLNLNTPWTPCLCCCSTGAWETTALPSNLEASMPGSGPGHSQHLILGPEELPGSVPHLGEDVPPELQCTVHSTHLDKDTESGNLVSAAYYSNYVLMKYPFCPIQQLYSKKGVSLPMQVKFPLLQSVGKYYWVIGKGVVGD